MPRSLRQEYAEAVKIFRDEPTVTATEVARRLGVDPRVVRSMYAHGYRGAPSIKETLEAEKAQARALLEEQARVAREGRADIPELAQLDLAKERAADAKLVRSSKEALLESVDVAHHGQALVARIESEDLAKLAPGAAFVYLSRVAMFQKTISDGVDKLVRLGQLLLGQPDQIIAVQAPADLAEARAEVERLRRDLEIASEEEGASVPSQHLQ